MIMEDIGRLEVLLAINRICTKIEVRVLSQNTAKREKN